MKLLTTHTIHPDSKARWVHPNYNGYMLTVYLETQGTWSCTVRNLKTKAMWTLTGIAGTMTDAANTAKAIADGNHGEASLTMRK